MHLNSRNFSCPEQSACILLSLLLPLPVCSSWITGNWPPQKAHHAASQDVHKNTLLPSFFSAQIEQREGDSWFLINHDITSRALTKQHEAENNNINLIQGRKLRPEILQSSEQVHQQSLKSDLSHHIPFSGKRSWKLVERTVVGFVGSHIALEQSLSSDGFSDLCCMRDPNSLS
jgi:hypothetical protein